MPINYAIDWDTSWTTTSINSSSINNASSSTTAAISNDGKVATEIAVVITYSTSPSSGVVAYILRDTDGSNYETTADSPIALECPYSDSGTHRKVLSVPANQVSRFKVCLTNSGGQTITASVLYRQSIIAQL